MRYTKGKKNNNNIEFVIRAVQQIKNNKTIPGYICQTPSYICSQTGQDSGLLKMIQVLLLLTYIEEFFQIILQDYQVLL